MNSTQRQPIPITALTGFLGSGKTTLLNYLLKHNQGRKIAVIVNDYGDINIDASMIAGQTDTQVELSNGCVCCSLDSLELDDAIGQFAYEGSPIDHIVIEASGLAEPTDLARTLSGAGSQHCVFESLIGVVDASTASNQSGEERRLIMDTIKAADLLVISKTDLASQGQLEDLQQLIEVSAPKVRVLHAIKGAADPNVLLGRDAELATSHYKHTHHPHDHTHLHEQYQSFSFQSQAPLDPPSFQHFVNAQLPTSVVRAKGFVDLGVKGLDRCYVFQLVGKRASIHWEEWGERPRRTELVFIGKDMPEAKIKEQLRACVDTEPESSADVVIVAPPAQ